MASTAFKTVLTTMAVWFLAACSGESAVSNTAPAAAPTASESAATEPSTSSSDAAANTAATATGKNYVVVSQPSYPPFATRGSAGEIVGLDVDLLNEIAKREGFSLSFVPHNMEGLLESLNDGSADIVATGVNITPERAEQYTFSEPYLEGAWVALVNKNKNQFNNWSDLKEKNIAVQGSSLSETQLNNTRITSKVMPMKTVYLGVSAVESGSADAVYDVDSVLNTYIKPTSSYYTVVDTASGKIPFGFVMKKGNTELKTKIDKGLQAIKADGTYQKILDKWYPSTNLSKR